MIDLNLNTESKRSACSDKQLKGKKKKEFSGISVISLE